VHYAAKSRGNPTFINLDKPCPNEIFTVLIWGSDRPKFGDPEESYRSKHICATAASRDDCVEATRISRQTVWQRVKRGELEALHVRKGQRKAAREQRSDLRALSVQSCGLDEFDHYLRHRQTMCPVSTKACAAGRPGTTRIGPS
jgi:hypothetical protein